MTIQNKSARAQLADGGASVLSGEECLGFLMKKIDWNVRSLSRQVDILGTAISELDGCTNDLKDAETELGFAVDRDGKQSPNGDSKIRTIE